MNEKLLKEVQKIIREIANERASNIENKRLKDIFERCFINTIETTVEMNDKDTFVITGDIPAMWLRDSTSQIEHYLTYINKSDKLKEMVKGLISRQMKCILIDPYANAFKQSKEQVVWDDDKTNFVSEMVWERKYEIDSLCYPIKLINRYWKETGDDSIFTSEVKESLNIIMELWEREQYHCEKSEYFFERENCPPTDTLVNNGKGIDVSYTGMTWSGFRPSDDACDYGYLVPANMFAAVVLSNVEEFAEKIYKDDKLFQRAKKLRKEIEHGIETFGRVEVEGFGQIYAYETDGRGNYNFMDDANVPSLLSIPYLGYKNIDDEIYQNTRRFILSKNNPFYYEGKEANGIGSPHTPNNYVWHIALSLQGLTSNDNEEIFNLIETCINTDAGEGFMHEGFNCDNAMEYTRPWFAWSNSMFAYLVDTAINKGIKL